MRTFVAINLPHEAKELLRGVQTALDRGFRGVSWVKPESMHLTLKFLGEIDEARAADAAAALERAAAGAARFDLEIEGVGAFPNARNPRVVWAGVRPVPGLMALQQAVEKALRETGFEAEDRPFSPHLTLCRVKSPVDGRALGSLVAGAAPVRTSFTVSSFAFMKSVLKPSGALHAPIKEFALKAQNN